jgi:hypothetical protein
VSLPLHWSAEGLPIGVHFGAPFGAEARLFRIAGQLERAQPWFSRRPRGARPPSVEEGLSLDEVKQFMERGENNAS